MIRSEADKQSLGVALLNHADALLRKKTGMFGGFVALGWFKTGI